MDFKPISAPDICPLIMLGIHRETANVVAIIETQGHRVTIEVPPGYRTAAMLMADDAMDMIDLLLAGDDGAAEIVAEICEQAVDCAANVTVNGATLGAPVRLGNLLPEGGVS